MKYFKKNAANNAANNAAKNAEEFAMGAVYVLSFFTIGYAVTLATIRVMGV